MITIPADLLGREVDLGTITVTPAMIAAYATAVGDVSALAEPLDEAPPTFCLALRRGMTPEIQLPPDMFGVYGGHDLEFHHPLRAGACYRITGRVTDVYEKIGRSGTLMVVVREATIRDDSGQLAARIVERQIVRRRPSAAATV
jgi:acyl dehydratase